MLTLKSIAIVCGLFVCLTTQAGCSGCAEPCHGGDDAGTQFGGGGGPTTIKPIEADSAGTGGQGGAGDQCIDQCDCSMCCETDIICTEAACCQACCH